VDVAPTLLELAGLKAPSAMQGRSLVPLLKGKKSADWRQSQFYSYWGSPNHYGIRTGRYTYVKLAGHPPELFDRQLDPSQFFNVAGEPKSKKVLERLEKELQRQIKAVDIRFSELPKDSRDEKRKRKPGAKKSASPRNQSKKLQQ
jgi:arylsulfatase A-like enzyme